MNDHTKRIRLSARTKHPKYEHSPPVVVWWCRHKPRRRILRVFLTRGGWHVLGNEFRVPMEEWLKRVGSDLTAEDIHAGRATTMSGRDVSGVDQWLPLDIDSWQPSAGTFEVGCACRAESPRNADIKWLAEDCRHAREERRAIERVID